MTFNVNAVKFSDPEELVHFAMRVYLDMPVERKEYLKIKEKYPHCFKNEETIISFMEMMEINKVIQRLDEAAKAGISLAQILKAWPTVPTDKNDSIRRH